MTSPHELWEQTLGRLEHEVPQATFQTWLSATHGLDLQDGELIVSVPTRYAKEWIEARLKATIDQALGDVAGDGLGCRPRRCSRAAP